MVFHSFFCFCLWLLSGLSGVYTDETVTILVMEGDSVTLNNDFTERKRDDQILWTFRLNSSDNRIAQTNTQSISISDSGENERFRHRLQIDNQTGSLTITNTNKLHSGLYKVHLISGVIKHKSFSVHVYGILPVPVIIRDSSQNSSSSLGSSMSTCSLLCSVLNVRDVSLSWYKGNSLLSSISVSDLSISLSLPLEVEYQDKNTYSCVINNPISNQTKHLDISGLCQRSSESNQTSNKLLVVLVLLLMLLVATAVVALIRCHRRNYTQAKQQAQSNDEEVDYTDATFFKHRDQEKGANGHDQTVYSEVVLR
ncbi:natural killer cell receptor 2B4-like [Labeo rohita]|uniref:natural killer cell receptor 2B4-like n=1 Tax=Labeo rohita TaxID=84645 RepID=UPI0021E1C4ED|nr:natural killer cell receptor 2B4-like [Labeo rohita]